MNDNPSPTVRFTLRENASILIEGSIEMIGPDGNKIETKEKFSLCRCGGSKNKPFCDGSHKANDFSSNPC
ncbi:MAG: CDGSH iron-sulfur domain-containing protein [candidate division Zixibacteria bacterium]|nr:CDGSH iron-sulfur domain-containing protein [candidate division Zixibacteria bacterium]